MIRLEADDSQVRALTVKALADIAARDLKAALTIRCRACGAQLAQAGVTTHGCLFTSAWAVERPDVVAITVNGIRLSPREALKYRPRVIVEQSGPTNESDRHGVIGLLTVAPTLPQDYPDLLVRCPDDGDAVLDRHQVLAWLRDDRHKVHVDVTFPRLSYRMPDPAFGAEIAKTTTAREVRRSK